MDSMEKLSVDSDWTVFETKVFLLETTTEMHRLHN